MSGGGPRVFRGIGASPGVAIGRVFLFNRGQVRVPRYHIAQEQVEAEKKRLMRAIGASVAQLAAIRARFVDEGMDHQAILESHEMMLRDRSLVDEALGFIDSDLLCAEWAISSVIVRLRNLFEQVSDAYFRERRGDIDFVGERILRNLMGQHADLFELTNLGDDCVVVARDLSPVDTTVLLRQKVCAFVTEVGGKTSHTSIIARSLEVPAVVGAQGILEAAGSDDVIVVDGLDGTVMLRPSRAQLDRGQKRAVRFHEATLDMLEAKALPATTLDGHELLIGGNIEHPREVPTVLARGGESIGLYRTEFMFVGRTQAPNEDDHFRAYCRIFDHVGDRPVTVRTFDLGSDKSMGLTTAHAEPNPALGLRAIRFCLKHRDLFAAQLAGLLRAAVHGDLRIMLPMISDLGEIRAVRALIDEVAATLLRQGKTFRADVPLGVMVEVPSAALTADILAREADFFAVGTNDLMQYLLAIDRTNERVAYLYQPLHPAVLRCLQTIAQAAKAAAITVSICGEMAGDAEFTPILLGLGFTQLSMNAGSIPKVKRLIREVNQSECQQLLVDVLQDATAEESAQRVHRFIREKVSFAHSITGPLA